MHRPRKAIDFVRTTAIGGLLFLLPLIVLGALIGQAAPLISASAHATKDYLPVHTPGGFASLIGLIIAALLLLCFAAGLAARWSLSQRLSDAFESKLLLLFPRYAIIKDRMADTFGGGPTKAQMKPVLVRFDDHHRIGFETERDPNTSYVAVYLPGSPDAWSGKVVLIDADRVEPLPVDFGVALATCEQLGRGATRLLAARQSGKPS